MKEKVYICIDLKSFYASVECVDRGLDPMSTNLVVADNSRTEKTICLAVTPALKSFKIPGRARLFEVIQKVDEVNRLRRKNNFNRKFITESYDINELNSNPNLKLSFIIAPPRMAKYMEVSTKIYNVYLKYVAPEDIHVYSIDEVFMDVTNYLEAANMTPFEFAKNIIKDVMKETNITATAGIGSNLYLAKVAMDIVAKHINADSDGVRIASLDEASYRKNLWNHRPLTDFWRVGKGISKRLEKMGLYTMGDIARCSVGNDNNIFNEELLYKEFGINAELLIDHAWGYEPVTIKDIKEYKPKINSLTSGQVLSCGYDYHRCKVVIKEMVELLSLDLVKKNLVTNSITLTIGYDIDNLKDEVIMSQYKGELAKDYIGRTVPKASHGSSSFEYTSSTTKLLSIIDELYERIVSKVLLIKRLNISVNNVIVEDRLIKKEGFKQLDIFSDYEEVKRKEIKDEMDKKREKNLQQAIIGIKSKYGKNSVLKGMDLEDGATTIERNGQIGGHKS